MNFRFFFLACFAAVTLLSCKKHEPTDLAKENIIPKPVLITASRGVFELKKEAAIYVKGDPDLQRIGQYLADKLKPSTGFELAVSEAQGDVKEGSIYLTVEGNDTELGNEGYEINITDKNLTLKANKPEGVFRGIQTIRQLLPTKVELSEVQQGPWEFATGTIRDFPTYSFRGSMLDLGRHFFGVDDVKRYIDLIAFYKMNSMHLHLSDDQGWRIEIKSWPNLTAHGGSTEVGGGKGGFYTQEQYKDIVKYAQERFINVIPEIDMPGHTNAALASYPELNCNGKATALYSGIEVGFSTLCANKDITYKFIDDVVRELAEITPGPYIHAGGDESHATKKEDYIKIVERVQDIIQSHGKQMIGWEEIAQTKLKPGTVVQYWSNANYAKEAAAKGAKIIMSPATKVYLDMKYDTTTKLGQDWAARIEIDSSYNWALSTRVKGIGRENIIGVETPLWTETITNMDEIEYMVFPRLPGIAEIGWSPEPDRSWEEYKARLAKHGPRLQAMKIDYYKSKQVPWEEEKTAVVK